MNLNNSNTFSICLNMIVKNEEKNIHKCLSNLIKYFDFDFITICDTGSTDETVNIINNFLTNFCIFFYLVSKHVAG